MSGVLQQTRPRPGVVQLTLARPERLNALDADLFAALDEALNGLARDDTCRAVVLTGTGRAFCAGADIEMFGALLEDASPGDVRGFWEFQRRSAMLVPKLRGLPQPVVAAVNGVAVGAGLSLLCASDVRLAAESARIACAGRRVGLSGADMGTGWLLPRLVGLARAQELMLTGRSFTAREALDHGLLVAVHRDSELLAAALDVAAGLADAPPFATRVTKEALWDSLETVSLQAMMDLENRHQAMLVHGPEHREAVRSFLARRQRNAVA